MNKTIVVSTICAAFSIFPIPVFQNSAPQLGLWIFAIASTGFLACAVYLFWSQRHQSFPSHFEARYLLFLDIVIIIELFAFVSSKRVELYWVVIPFFIALVPIFFGVIGRKTPKAGTAENRKTRQKTEIAARKKAELQQVLKVSTRLSVARFAELLDMDTKTVWKRVLEWAEQFHFTIEGEDLVFNKATVGDFIASLDKEFGKATVGDFIASLDKEFATWGKDGKV